MKTPLEAFEMNLNESMNTIAGHVWNQQKKLKIIHLLAQKKSEQTRAKRMQSTKYEFYVKSDAQLRSKSVPLFDQFHHLMDGKLLGKYSNSSCVVLFSMGLSLFVILFTP